MTKIEEIENKIRDTLHDSAITKTKVFQKKDKGFWDQLWTSLDTIGDTDYAIKSFRDLDKEEFQKSAYVLSYGLLQALFLQQDAVCNLKESIIGKGIIWKKEYPGVYLIRTIRNESTGHPTKNNRNEQKTNIYAVIDRSTLSKEGFSYMLWSEGIAERKSVIFDHLIQTQEDALRDELIRILETIQKAEQNHKESFKGELLAPMLPDQEPYSLSLLRKIVYDELAWHIFLKFKEDYELIKTKIEARYGPIKNSLSIPGTELLINELDRIFLRITELKRSSDDVEIDIGIYANALVEKLKDLRTHLEEIDGQFRKKG